MRLTNTMREAFVRAAMQDVPADEPKALRSLPALANVAADFVKAGWPKGRKPATRKTA